MWAGVRFMTKTKVLASLAVLCAGVSTFCSFCVHLLFSLTTLTSTNGQKKMNVAHAFLLM